MTVIITVRRVQWIAAFLTILAGTVFLYAQNPVSIAQIGPSTAVTTTVPISGSITNVSGTVTLPTGASTAARQDTGNTSLSSIDGKITAVNTGAVVISSGTVTANMGTVTADPFGANADAASATGSMSAKLRFIAGTGIPVTGTVTVASHAVTNAGTFAVQAALADPCAAATKAYVSFSISTATTTQLIAASASNFNYICSISVGPVQAADNIALIEDDTSACASPTAGMAGGTTAASGWNIAANGGLTFGNGLGTIYKTAATNRYTCLITSAATQASGAISYVQVP